MYYEDVFKKLDEKGVRYLVVGGVALVLHGVIRLTADLDLMVWLDEGNLAKFIVAMKEIGYKPKVPVKAEEFIDPAKRQLWKEEKGMQVFSFYHPAKPMNLIDVFVDEPIDFLTSERRKVTMKAKQIKIPVISKGDLIKLKRLAGRPQDLADIDALNELERLKEEEANE
jgi:hypothetical protein